MLDQFALRSVWQDQFPNIKDTIFFFRSEYVNNPTFAARVDEEAERAGDISPDFSAGIDMWGAPTFTANSDEVEAFIRGLFPPDIAERVEIRRQSAIIPPDAATP